MADYLTFPEHRFDDPDAPAMPSVRLRDEDAQREQDARWLLSEMIEFRKAHGHKALVRLLAEAL